MFATAPRKPITTQVPVMIQKCGDHACTGGCKCEGRGRRGGKAPSVGHVLKSPGEPLDASTRSAMEGSFGHNFADVRIHADDRAAATARAERAQAFTVGSHVVFGRDRYSPATTAGRWLLAHELTHVIQQRGSAAGGARVMRMEDEAAPPDAGPATAEDLEKQDPAGPATEESEGGEPGGEGPEEEEEVAEEAAPQMKTETPTITSGRLEREADDAADRVTRGERLAGGIAPALGAAPAIQRFDSTICGRASTQFRDFPATYISHIDVDLASPQHPVTLTWTGPNAARGETGPLHSSPGAGNCGVNCNDTAASRTAGSHCTPKVTDTPIHRQACALGGHPEATNASYFSRPGIAFHRYPSVPNHPASHGCVRLGEADAQLIYDNVRTNVTTVTVGGTWVRGMTGPKGKRRPVCW